MIGRRENAPGLSEGYLRSSLHTPSTFQLSSRDFRWRSRRESRKGHAKWPSHLASNVKLPWTSQGHPAWKIALTPSAAVPRMALLETLGWLLMAAFLVLALRMAYLRAVNGGPDLALFCDAGRCVLHAARAAPFGGYRPYLALGQNVPGRPPGCCRIYRHCRRLAPTVNCLAWLGLLRLICETAVGVWSRERGAGSHAVVLPAPGSLLPALRRPPSRHARRRAAGDAAGGGRHGAGRLPRAHALADARRTGSGDAGKGNSGGVLLGIAAWLKLVPLLGVALLVYHRKWKAAAVAMSTVVFLDVALSLAAFGPAAAWREHVSWWRQGAQGTAERQLTCAGATDEDRLTNQSVAITLRRLLTSLGTPDASVHDAYAAARRRVQLAEVSPEACRAVYLVVTGLLVVAVAIYCRPG